MVGRDEGTGCRRVERILDEDRYILVKYRIDGGRVDDLRPEVTELHRLGKREVLDDIGGVDNPRVGRHKAVDIGPDFELRGTERRSQDGCRVVRPTPAEVGHIARDAVRRDEAGHHGHPGQLGKVAFHQLVGLVEVDNVLTILAAGLDEKAGIVVNRPLDDPTHDERREPLAVTHNRVERLGREVLDERHPPEDIAQFAQQRVDKGQQLELFRRLYGLLHHRLVTLDNGSEVALIAITAHHGHPGSLDQAVGNSTQSRHHDDNRLVTTLYYLFDTRHALDRTYRSASEFQYFHICTILSAQLRTPWRESKPHPFKKNLVEKLYRNGLSTQKTTSSPLRGGTRCVHAVTK